MRTFIHICKVAKKANLIHDFYWIKARLMTKMQLNNEKSKQQYFI